MKAKDVGNVLTQVTDGVVGTVTDLCLLQVFYILNLVGACGPRDIERAGDEACRLVSDEINYKKIKQAVNWLVHQQLLTRNGKDLEITYFGKKRIAELIPTYQTKRPWDGFLYLISYDIPSSQNAKRDRLRMYIKKIAGGLLQDSLWMTPYNPTKILEEFVSENNIPGTILVSKIGKDGSVGEENLSDLIARVYKLDELNSRYQEFLQNNFKEKLLAVFAYLSILKNDPQLPFELEPKDFLGKTAYTVYTKYLKRNS